MDVFSSRSVQNPTYDNSLITSWNGRTPIVFQKEKNKDFAGSFYISICGTDSSTYTVLATIDRETDGNPSDST